MLLRTWHVIKCILYELQPVRIVDVIDAARYVYKFTTELGNASMVLSEYGYQNLFEWVTALSHRTWLLTSLWFLAWMAMIYAEFGSLWIILSMIASIFLNLGERKKGELSAYSVFNEGFKQLLGTMDAQQFDNEIRHNIHARRGHRQIVQIDDVVRAEFSDDDDNFDAHGEIRAQDRRIRRQQQGQHRHAQAAAAAAAHGDNDGQPAGANAPVNAAAVRRKGKKGRRNYEERLHRQQAAQKLREQREEAGELVSEEDVEFLDE